MNTKYFALDFYFEDKLYNTKVTVMNPYNQLQAPMIRISMNDDRINPTVFIFYMLDETKTLFHYPIPNDVQKQDIQKYFWQHKIVRNIKVLLEAKIGEWNINYEEWLPEKIALFEKLKK